MFLSIWFIILFSFTMVGVQTFQEVAELSSFETGFIYFIQASFGEYDLTIFDVFVQTQPERKLLRQFGIGFVLSFVFINMLLLLNIVIAMMADTYAMMTSVRRGIYNYSVVRVSPAYRLDKNYGGLTLLFPPFCLISTFCLLPYYMCVKDTKRLRWFN